MTITLLMHCSGPWGRQLLTALLVNRRLGSTTSKAAYKAQSWAPEEDSKDNKRGKIKRDLCLKMLGVSSNKYPSESCSDGLCIPTEASKMMQGSKEGLVVHACSREPLCALP